MAAFQEIIVIFHCVSNRRLGYKMSVTDAMKNEKYLLKSSYFSNKLCYHILNLIKPEYISKEKNTEMFVNQEKIIAEEAKASVTDA